MLQQLGSSALRQGRQRAHSGQPRARTPAPTETACSCLWTHPARLPSCSMLPSHNVHPSSPTTSSHPPLHTRIALVQVAQLRQQALLVVIPLPRCGPVGKQVALPLSHQGIYQLEILEDWGEFRCA